MWSYNYELYHHGIMGMKWGVRRYQNKDGSLTPKGVARFKQVEANPRLSKRQEKEARNIYAEDKKRVDTYAAKNNRSSKKAHDKTDKLVLKSEARQQKGDRAGFDKYQSKARKMLAKSITAERGETYWKGQSALLSKKIEDLDTGVIKAGRDFIIQRDVSVFALPGIVSVDVNTQIIEK